MRGSSAPEIQATDFGIFEQRGGGCVAADLTEVQHQPRSASSREAGKGIAEDCKGDPHALLFAVVDKHVRRLPEAAGR